MQNVLLKPEKMWKLIFCQKYIFFPQNFSWTQEKQFS